MGISSGGKLFPFFGFTAENIVAKAHKVLGVKGA